MIRLLTALTLALLATFPVHALTFASTATENLSWQAPFTGAVSWTTYGVTDDNVTDNAAALNSIPGNVPVIADCPHGGTVHFSSSWFWPNNLLVWQQPGCRLISDSTDLRAGKYAISGLSTITNTSPVTNVKYYGLDITCSTPVDQLKAIGGWFDHLKLLHFTIKQCGAFIWRGSDREVAYGSIDTTPETSGGNPGFRDLGNVPLVFPAPGMWANVDYHHNYVRSGDAAYQACQSINSATYHAFAGVSTYGILYRDSTVNTYSNMGLISWSNAIPPFSCLNITYEHITGTAVSFMSIIPGQGGVSVDNIRILNSTLAQSADSLRQGSYIGNFRAPSQPAGGFAGTNLSNVALSNLTLTANKKTALSIYGCFPGITLNNSSLAGVDSAGNTPILLLTGTCGVAITNTKIATAGSDGIRAGVNSSTPSPTVPTIQAIGTILTNNTITEVSNGSSGIALLSTTGTSVTNGTITPQRGSTSATGVTLTPNPNGTLSSSVHNVTVTAMPTPIACAPPSQLNIVTSNPGAADCP